MSSDNAQVQNKENSYKVEGLDKDDGGLEDYPLRELAIRDEKRTAIDIVRRIMSGKLILDPDFQRDFVWDEKKQSKLIESIIMRIPLPVFYVAEDNDGKLIVVDGLQRLTTISRFCDNKFKLKLESRSELKDKKFEELKDDLKIRIEDCQLHFYIIDSNTPIRAKLDIFERVNGGDYLTRQQMRNALYNGKATNFIRDLAKSDLFIKVTGESLNPRTMQDREFVNRFCSFILKLVSDYKEMDEWLADGLEIMNNSSDKILEELRIFFERSLKNNLELFEKHAFRKFSNLKDDRTVINASLFDCMSTSFAFYPTERILEKKAELLTAYSTLLIKEEFSKSISSSTSSANRVQCRHTETRKMLKEVLGDPLPSSFQF